MAMFSKRHYQEVAEVLRAVREGNGTVADAQLLFARRFGWDNPRFDAERFNKACEPKGRGE